MEGRTITRADLSESVFQEVGLSRNESSDLVETILAEVVEALARGESVKISSFGSFTVRDKGQRVGRNPKTGQEVPILPRRVLVFRASNVLKSLINGAPDESKGWLGQCGGLDMAVSLQTADRRVEKSAQAFRTISEVATELDVPQHVLRFWESKFSQVRPLKRGGGRRYYRPEDVDLLRRIRTLLYEDGYTIKGVQRLLKEGRGRLPAQRLDIAAESALESLRIVSARAEAMAAGSNRQPLPRTGPQPSTTTPRAAVLDLHKRREIESVLEDLEQALTQLRTTLKASN
jgi:integration host factor subunit alpha